MAREYFCAYHSLIQSLEPFGDAERGRLFTAALQYSATGIAPQLSGNERFLWPTLQTMIDRDKEAYEAKCQKNATNAAKRYDRMRPHANGCETCQEKEKEKEEEKEEYKKESKKESAPVQLADYVTMTNAEHQKLLDAYGEADTARLIEILDNYKGSTGKRYKSDYRAILSWCVERLAEEKGKEKPSAKAPLVQTSAGDAEAAMVRRLNT